MNKKLLILISVLLTCLIVSYVLIMLPPMKSMTLIILRATLILVFTISSVAVIIYSFSRLLKRTLHFAKCYIIAAMTVSMGLVIAFNISSKQTTTSIETTTVGNGEEQTLYSKQYNNEGGLKQEIKVQVTKNTGDSTIVDYDTDGNIIRKKTFKLKK